MFNPSVLLALVLGWLVSVGGAAWFGYDYRDGKVAQELLTHANAYTEATRRNVEVESAESLRKAKAAAARRAKDREAIHNLEMELAKDEAARTCRVGAGTLGVLQRSIRESNALAAPPGGVDGTVRPAEGATDGNSGGTGAGITGRSAAVRGSVPAGGEPR